MYNRILIAAMSMALILVSIYLPKTAREITSTMSAPSVISPTFIIDAGHGGIDGGTSGADGTKEKDINLSIAKKLETILKASGFSVVMTRTEDDLISDPSLDTIRKRKNADLLKRLEIVNTTEQSVLISIHQNYFHESQYSGAQVFYSDNHQKSKILAEIVQNSIKTDLQPNNSRQTKAIGADVFLLDQCMVPGIMIECGFMSNPKELSLLKNEIYQTKIAFSIALSLISFYTE